jgi:RNAse (barnase) inhibitor barstar
MRIILIDWATIGSREEFYDRVLPQMDAPSWHGRTLDALQDSWVTGGICPSGPPFAVDFKRTTSSTPDLCDFASEVEEIARASVQRHGGSFSREYDQ